MPVLPRTRRHYIEDYLFSGASDRFFKNAHTASVCVGDYYEEATAALFSSCGVQRLNTQSDCECCPDLQQARFEFFIESKAFRFHKACSYKADCMERYSDLVNCFVPPLDAVNPDWNPLMLHVFWAHKVTNLKRIWSNDLRQNLAANTDSCIVLQHNTVCKMLGTRKTEFSRRWVPWPFIRLLHSQIERAAASHQCFDVKLKVLDTELTTKLFVPRWLWNRQKPSLEPLKTMLNACMAAHSI